MLRVNAGMRDSREFARIQERLRRYQRCSDDGGDRPQWTALSGW